MLTTLYEHNREFMVLALSICVFGAITSVRVLQLAAASAGRRRMVWLLVSGTASGCTIWSAHFIAMLGLNTGLPTSYAWQPMAVALAAGITFSIVSGAVMMRREGWAPYIAGSLLGIGVVAAHFIGMSAIQVPGRLAWNPDYVALSMVFAVLFSVIALAAIRKLPADRGLLSGSVALACSVLFLHFTGIGVASVVHDPNVVITPSTIPNIVFAYGAAISTCFILAVALICVVFDQRMTQGRVQAERKIHYLAYHDGLTGLPNRTALNEALRARIDAVGQSGQDVALLALNLDRFKQVNDIFGHQAGDSLLRHIAEMIRAELTNGEFLARVGGDEFVIIQSGAAQPDGARDLGERLLDAVCRDVSVEGVTFRAAASIGVALCPRDGHSAAVLYPNADAALHRAKQDGRGVLRFFKPEMDLALREKRTLQLEMRDALKRGQFRLYYQPQAETMTGVISGFEALLRWEHPQRGLINPVDFVPAAEENGFIVELGEFVIRTACTEAATWSKPLTIAVNLSPVQFQHGDLVALVQGALKASGLAPQRLELEITESVLIDDMSRALDILHRLKDLGVCVAMDDFGTGYSSLAYLQAFPFDRIKIDRSFIAGLDSNKQSEAIIRAVVGLGRGLNVPVTAEGVETEAQQTFLAELDCTEIQGFLIGKPQPIEFLEMHLGRQEGRGNSKIVA